MRQCSKYLIMLEPACIVCRSTYGRAGRKVKCRELAGNSLTLKLNYSGRDSNSDLVSICECVSVAESLYGGWNMTNCFRLPEVDVLLC